MGLLDNARADLDTDDTTAEVAQGVGDTASLSTRDATVMAGGEQVSVEPPSTVQTDEDTGTWLSGSNEYGRPRGTDALENRQIVQTSAMQAIVNGVADQILGGELTFVENDDVDAPEQQVAQLRDLIESVLTGPHLQDVSLDDLITAAIEDMMGPGQAYWQLLGAQNADLPVASLIELDPLTIRHNVSRHGVPQDPPYWQANSAFSGGSVSSLGNVDPVALQKEDIAVMSYPKGHRSYQQYPISPAWQVREWLEVLANETTHINRFYADDETSSGLLQVVGASNSTVKDVKEKLEDASGDPRSAAVIGGEGGAQWLELGGQSVNMDVIAEQEWFFYLCLGALGLGKSELGMIEDVNRSNGEIESTRVYKRVAQPFIAQFEEAFLHVCRQFDAFNEMGEPFKPTISFSDPREERAKEQRLMDRYQNGTLTLEEFYRRTSDGDEVEEDQWTVEIGGSELNYGEHPRWVAQALLQDAGDGVAVDDDPQEDDEGEE